ncbi:MAG: hypothetical protein ACKV2T_32975 [Kofleriaceae bacterium]
MADDESSEAPRSYSVAVRIRRTTVEFVHVRVPVTDAVVTDDHLDGEKIFAAAIEIGKTDVSLCWLTDEAAVVDVHPLQTPPPEFDN